ncbi:MAG TPA: PAS domain S-box protein [Anaerolineae bacterium]|nr:PAS domain S-box protein [Anaerolineae bacterium]HQK15076.1 PAS domain S-box protein [Anaerolineae bacterium]
MAKILLLMEHRQNCRLLAEMLAPRYEVLIPSSDEALQDEFDLGIVDGVMLDRLWTQVQARKEAARPAFLPFLLVTTRQDVGQATRHLWKTIDELIISPIEKVELQARVEVLLQARRLSLESEAWFRTTLYSIGLAVIATDRRGIIRQMNAEAERLTGWCEAEAQGQPLEAVFHIANEETRAPLENPVQRVLREGPVTLGLDSYVLLNARDGVEYPIAGSGTPVRDESGTLIGVVIAFRNHGPERAAQRALQESEARFRALFEKAGLGIALMDIGDGSLIACNPALVRFLGYSEDELHTLTFKDTTHPDDLAEDERLWGELCAGQCDLYTLEKRYYRKDGQLVWGHLTASLIRDAAGKPLSAVVMVEDITERKQTEETLRQQEQLHRALIDALDVCLCRWLPDTTLTYANEKYCQTFRILDDPRNHKWLEFVPDADREAIAAFYRELAARPHVVTYEHPVIAMDGSLRHYHWTDVPLCNDSGQVMEFQSVGIDITERKRIEAKLAEQLADLRRWHEATLGREGRILELKHEVNEQLRRLGEPIRYPSAEDQDPKGLGDL